MCGNKKSSQREQRLGKLKRINDIGSYVYAAVSLMVFLVVPSDNLLLAGRILIINCCVALAIKRYLIDEIMMLVEESDLAN